MGSNGIHNMPTGGPEFIGFAEDMRIMGSLGSDLGLIENLGLDEK